MNSKNKAVEIAFESQEDDTVRLAQNGNMKAFEHIVTLYEGYIYNLAYNIFNNSLDAQDVTQEIFLRIYRNLKSFKHNSKFKTWVYRITINACIDEYKKKKSRIFEITDNEDDEEFVDFSNKSPEQLVLEREIREELKKLLKKLPIKYRVPVMLRDLQGLSYDEISETLKLKVGTVKTRINRGRMKLRDKYIKLEKKKNNPQNIALAKNELVKGGRK